MRIIPSNPHYIGVSTSWRLAAAATALGWVAAAQSSPPAYLIQTVAGSDVIGDGGPADKALLQTVEGLASDPLGNYYLSDTDSHRIDGTCKG